MAEAFPPERLREGGTGRFLGHLVPAPEEIPSWDRLQKRYPDQGFTILGIRLGKYIKSDIEKIQTRNQLLTVPILGLVCKTPACCVLVDP